MHHSGTNADGGDLAGSARDCHGHAAYRCIHCGTGPLQSIDRSLRCSVCSADFPLIDGIPIFVHRAGRVVDGTRGAADAVRAQAQRFAEEAATSPEAVRAARAARAMLGNLSLLSPPESPSRRHAPVDPPPVERLLDAFATAHAGWSLDELLPYFHQDWTREGEFQKVARLIEQTLANDSPDTHSVVVLGAAACGLAYELAGSFDEAFAVELSLSALSLARRILDNEEVVVNLQAAAWRPSHMRRSGPSRDNIRLVVADAVSLPFGEETRSAIVTQYLMDAVGNPWAVIDEIARTLKPGGIWVNFSLPFRLPDEPLGSGRPDTDEIADLIRGTGLHIIGRESARFSPVDVSDIDPDAMTFSQSVQFFVARKEPGEEDHPSPQSTRDDAWWQGVPRFARGRNAQITSTVSISARGPSTSRGMQMGGAVGAFGIGIDTEEDAKMLEAVLRAMDGLRNLRDIREALESQGHRFTKDQFGELLHYLSRRDGLIVIDTARM